MGGYFINHGILPYTGFFAHHVPFAYFYASIITLFSGASFVAFRPLLAISYFLLIILFYVYIKKRFGNKESTIFLVFSGLIAITGTYVWGQMLLADSLVGYLLTPVYITILLICLKKDLFTLKDVALISILSAFSLLTSVTFSYAILIIYLFTIFLYFVVQKRKIISFETIKFFAILAIPYIIFSAYLLITRSFNDFYYQAIFFTKEYYLTMPDGSPVHNPLRYAVVLFYNFMDKYRVALVLVKDLNFGNPFAPALALSNLVLLVYLLINRKFKELLFVAGLLVYLNGRSNPLTTGETDYQAIPYQYFSLFNGIFVITLIWNDLKNRVEDNKKIIYAFFLLLLGLYFSFLTFFLFNKFSEKAYLKYMGTQSMIYDRPAVANVINSLISKDDYYYIGPFAFEDLLYTKGKLASKYIVTIPAMDKAEKIQQELIADIQKNKPRFIVFDTEYYIFGKQPGVFLLNYLHKEYVNLEQLKGEGLKYEFKQKFYGNYDFERHFFFDKNQKDSIINELVSKGLLTIK